MKNTESQTPSAVIPTASVVMTTFRSPRYLRRVLDGFANQTNSGGQPVAGFEIVVGEDGQTPETKSVIDEFQSMARFRVRYVTQPHEGFGKTRILNRAIDAAEGDYLIFTDGDCVPHSLFMANHLEYATPGRFLSGGCIRLPRPITNQILDGERSHAEHTVASQLRSDGVSLSSKWLWIERFPMLASWFDRMTTTKPTFNGHNASAWREDVLRANGFNLEMRYGGLDRELGERLENAGVLGTQVRHRAICFHLDHDRGYVNREDWKRNHQIRKRVRNDGVTRAAHGLEEVRSIAG